MTPIWRHLTHPEGMTAKLLADATGMSEKAVRADLAGLELEGKAVRERAPIGKAHLWWRSGCKPLVDLDAFLALALAAQIHKSAGTLRAAMQRIAARTWNPGIKQIVILSAKSSAPHSIIWGAVDSYVGKTESARMVA